MNFLKLFEYVTSYVEGTSYKWVLEATMLVIFCSTVIFILAQIFYSSPISKLRKDIINLIKGGVDKLKDANSSPYDEKLKDNKYVAVFMICYFYLLALLMLPFSLLFLVIGFEIGIDGVFLWYKQLVLIAVGFLFLLFARLLKVQGDRELYKFRKQSLTVENKEKQSTSLKGNDSTVFFSERFSYAFPGVRNIEWFKTPKEAITRLSILLEEPLNFEGGSPVWWWRNGNNPIRKFKVIDSKTILLDNKELIVDEIAAVNLGAYYQSFVYVKAKPSKPSGLYDYSYVSSSVAHQGYASEEFALYKKKLITRAEYDDGAAIINGEPKKLNGDEELRIRYLTPYNFIVSAQNSPINNLKFDSICAMHLNKILEGKSSLDVFSEKIMTLPKREQRK